jgi:hypothetical protein
MLISNPLKIFLKNGKKSYQQKYALFPLLLMFVKLVLRITFFGTFEISMKLCVF